MITDELREKIGDRVLVVSVSGGKDSTATCLHLKELGMPYQAIFFDTGWEHQTTYEYLTEYLPSKIGPIKRLTRKRSMRSEALEALAVKYEKRIGFYSPMIRWIIYKGMFPSRTIRWCTQELKVYPAAEYLKNMDSEPINVVGIRAEESAKRSQMDEWEWSDLMDCEVWRPIIHWTFQDVIDIHHRHNVVPNALYLRDSPAERVGCYPCIFAKKKEIKSIDVNDPERLELLKDLEVDLHRIRCEKWDSKNKPHREIARWFQASIGGGWSIDRAVSWARTKHGGKQFELFDALPGEQGCIRWGMCDTGMNNLDRE